MIFIIERFCDYMSYLINIKITNIKTPCFSPKTVLLVSYWNILKMKVKHANSVQNTANNIDLCIIQIIFNICKSIFQEKEKQKTTMFHLQTQNYCVKTIHTE